MPLRHIIGLFAILLINATIQADDNAPTRAGLLLAKKPAAGAGQESRVHFATISGDASYLWLSVYIPADKRNEYQATPAGAPTYAWLASSFIAQRDARSDHDLGLLAIYGLGVKQDWPRAARLFASSVPAGLRDGPLHLTAILTWGDMRQPQSTRIALPVLLSLLAAHDWWSVRSAAKSWDHLMASPLEEDHALARTLTEPTARALIATFNASRLPGKDLQRYLLSSTDQWCYRMLEQHPPHAARQVKDIAEAWLKRMPSDTQAQLRLTAASYQLEEFEKALELAGILRVQTELKPENRAYVDDIRLFCLVKTRRFSEITHDEWLKLARAMPSSVTRFTFVVMALAVILPAPWLTRCRRTEIIPWWLCVMWLSWATMFATWLMAPWAIAVGGAVLCVVFQVWGLGGPKSPGYFRTPVSNGAVGWLRIIGWCVLGLVIFDLLSTGHARLYEQLTGHPLGDSPFTALLTTHSPAQWCCAMIVVAICVPVSEEIVFRGVLLGWLERWMKPWLAVVLSALAFGLGHGWNLAIPTFCFGVLATFLRNRYESLWPGIVFHGLTNALYVTMHARLSS